ncbi:serine/threonine-protein kinase fray2-like [Drosophila suzukii]|uniref:Serine/threonine-protein kinase fray2-like n=1 Tax=Drosophila suzukii TaxID=28584 RepID=A0ABM4TZ68_DROSZ
MLPGDRSRKIEDSSVYGTTSNNPITRTQEQRTNTVHHRNTRLQQRFREQQIHEMADERLYTYRSSSQNRQAESSRKSQRNIAARAQLSEDEREDQRERQRRRSRATAREQYLRNIKDGPTKFFNSQVGFRGFRRREQSRNTADHATWRSIEENRGLERLQDALAHRITRNNSITRTQEQRTNTVHHRNTRLQQRFREQQIHEMADERLYTYRSSSQNRQAESSRKSQRNIAARAQLSEDEREDQRERQRRRSRATAREQYLRNIKDGPTKFCTCCGGTWFPSQSIVRSDSEDSDDESSRETLLIMLPGDRSRKIEDSSVYRTH